MRPEAHTASTALREQAFEGTVMHQRRMDVDHGFEYRVWMALARVASSKLPRLLRPREHKYMASDKVLQLTGFAGAACTPQVWLLTQPSLVGRSFNPVSFYFVVADEQLCAIVAHITNTPWDEDHCYVLEQRGSDTWHFDKQFHVSPFMPMNLRYQWRFQISSSRIAIHMQLLDGGERVFTAALNLQPSAPSRWLPVKLRLKYPAQNLLTLGRIYWQAAVLKIKGAHFYAHPDNATAVHDRIR